MKRCKHCNNRMVDGMFDNGDLMCAECGREDWYETDGVTRKKINTYLRKNGWECIYSEEFMMPLHTAERWRKKGYDQHLAFQWLRRLDSSGALLIEDEQIWRAINHIADSEGIGYDEAADKIRQATNDQS